MKTGSFETGVRELYPGRNSPNMRYPKLHQPNCNETQSYALRRKKDQGFIQCIHNPLVETLHTKRASEARLFGGGFLNHTCFDWSIDYEAVPRSEVMKIIGQQKISR